MNLQGKKGLIVGIANNKSIAYGCAKNFSDLGAELAITYLNEKAKPFVEPIADDLNTELFLPLDVQDEDQEKFLFEEIEKKWGHLDFLIHSIAFAKKEDLYGRVTDCSLDGFKLALDISCHSLIRLSKLAEPLMKDGGSILTFSFYGAEKVVPNYSVMGPAKSALESVVRYLAADLAPKKIRVNALSPGLVQTRAASGIPNIDDLYSSWEEKTPMNLMASQDDIGKTASFFVSDWSKSITGNIVHVDAGYHIMA